MTILAQEKPGVVAPDSEVGLRRPRLRLYFYSAIASDTILFHVEGEENIWLRGPAVASLLPPLLPLLNGTLTVNELVERVGSDQRKGIVEILKLLRDRRIIEEGDPEIDLSLPPGYLARYQSQTRFFSHFHSEPRKAQAHLYRARLTLLDDHTSFGPHLAASLAEMGLNRLKLVGAADLAHSQPVAPTSQADALDEQSPYTQVSAHSWGYDWIAPTTLVSPPMGSQASYSRLEPLVEESNLVVVLSEGYGSRICDVVNELALKKGFRWLSISLKGSHLYLGPGILPRGTACWRCYGSRVAGNESHEEAYEVFEQFDRETHTLADRRRYGSLPGLEQLVAGMGANEIIKALTLYAPPLYGRVLMYDVVNAQQQYWEVLRLPRCKACGRDRLKVANKLWYAPRPLAGGTR